MIESPAHGEERIHIFLRSFCGPFDPAFLRGLAVLEKQMLFKGFDPSVFAVEKKLLPDNYLAAAYPLAAPSSYTYTVFVNDESFSTVRYDDMFFLKYFSALCLGAGDADAVLQKSLIERCMNWLRQDSI